MDNLISRKDIIDCLNTMNMAVTDVTLQRYSTMGLIAEPTFSGRGRGAQAMYPAADTTESVFAIHFLMSLEGLPISKMKYIVDLADYLETRNYKSHQEVLNDERLRDKIDGYPRLPFFTSEYLLLKHGCHDVLVQSSKSVTHMMLSIFKDKQAIYSFIEGPGRPVDIVPYVTQGLLVAIANNEEDILAKFR
ncbi:MAG: hypothetical protein ACYDHZ_03125 [Dehalococcoidia bacterium]